MIRQTSPWQPHDLTFTNTPLRQTRLARESPPTSPPSQVVGVRVVEQSRSSWASTIRSLPGPFRLEAATNQLRLRTSILGHELPKGVGMPGLEANPGIWLRWGVRPGQDDRLISFRPQRATKYLTTVLLLLASGSRSALSLRVLEGGGRVNLACLVDDTYSQVPGGIRSSRHYEYASMFK
ncbi:hypothetical protein G7046_g7363 [Stylonectria norvegica]|nr:hypothetical protein G7046_g7363 [Stylonectria norvegica]